MRAGPHTSYTSPPEEVADAVARDLEPCLSHPARDEVVRCVLLGRVPGPVLRDRVDLVEALRDRHAANGRSTRRPASGKSATTKNAARHEDTATSAPKSAG